MIGAQSQARIRPARGVFKSPATERDCRRQLMRCRVLRSRIQDPTAHSRRAFGPPDAEFRQSALKQRLSTRSWLCHRIPSSVPYSSDRISRRAQTERGLHLLGWPRSEPAWTAPGDIAIVPSANLPTRVGLWELRRASFSCGTFLFVPSTGSSWALSRPPLPPCRSTGWSGTDGSVTRCSPFCCSGCRGAYLAVRQRAFHASLRLRELSSST